MAKPLKVLFVCAEMAPLAGTGGLAEVAYALPRALRALGHDVRVTLPMYRGIPERFRDGQVCECGATIGDNQVVGTLHTGTGADGALPLYFLKHDLFFDRDELYGEDGVDYWDNVARFSFFCQATLDGVAQTEWRPDIVHCHDWHTAMLPAYIKTQLQDHPVWRKMPTLFTIHNLAYQGIAPAHELSLTGLSPDLFHPDCLEFYGNLNIMKAGIAFASKINVVSPRYAKEVLQSPSAGMGLEGFLRTRAKDVSGILNGVDYSLWNPATDRYITANYTREDMSGKSACKTELQARFNLPQCGKPLFGMVTRLERQKGIDLVVQGIRQFVKQDMQLAILGSGDQELEKLLAESAKKYPRNVSFVNLFDPPLSHTVVAGSDFLLMPSRFEPCGLTQMYAMAYGTIPIVRATGGLADTVRHASKVNMAKGRATGIVFRVFGSKTFVRSLRTARDIYGNKPALATLRNACMGEDFSWERSSKAYVQLYRKAIAKP